MNTVIVTGASRGLGKEIAESFVKSEWRVIGTGRSERPDSLNEKIEYVQFDASDTAAVAGFWQSIHTEGEVCLVNNAGGFVGGKLADTDADDFEKQMQSNFFAGVNMTRELVRNIERAKIINVNSAVSLATDPGMGPYGAAKTAAKQFFQSLRKELPAEKYQITNIYPSYIATNGQDPENAIHPDDLADLILQQAESHTSYYAADITLYPAKQ